MRSSSDDFPRRVLATSSRCRRSSSSGSATGTDRPWWAETPIRHPCVTENGLGRRRRAPVRSSSGTSAWACGRCQRPASSRVFRTGRRPRRGQRTQLAQVEIVLAEASRLQAVAGRQVELPIRRRESIQAFVHRRRWRVGRREDGQADLGDVGDAADLLLDQAHVVDGTVEQPSSEPDRGWNADTDGESQQPELQPLAGVEPLIPLKGQASRDEERGPA